MGFSRKNCILAVKNPSPRCRLFFVGEIVVDGEQQEQVPTHIHAERCQRQSVEPMISFAPILCRQKSTCKLYLLESFRQKKAVHKVTALVACDVFERRVSAVNPRQRLQRRHHFTTHRQPLPVFRHAVEKEETLCKLGTKRIAAKAQVYSRLSLVIPATRACAQQPS